MSKKVVKKGTIILLMAKYRECDDEVMGVFENKETMLSWFSQTIFAEHAKDGDPVAAAEFVALRTADLLGEGSDDGCIDGDTRYWFEEHEVYGFDIKDQGNG